MNLLKALALSITPAGRAVVAKQVQHKQDVLAVMTVLDCRKYRYEQVEAAINASRMSPRDIYDGILSNCFRAVL